VLWIVAHADVFSMSAWYWDMARALIAPPVAHSIMQGKQTLPAAIEIQSASFVHDWS
jgi:hypothetical protein